jgi:hypothetical protein
LFPSFAFFILARCSEFLGSYHHLGLFGRHK